MKRTTNFLLLLLMIVTLTCCSRPRNLKTTAQDTDSTGIVDSDYVAPLTIQDFLNFREDMIHDRHVTDVYTTMPTTIIAYILTTRGCDTTISDIVEEYETHKSFYDDTIKIALAVSQKVNRIRTTKDSVIPTIPVIKVNDSIVTK